jgi:16S rRNA (guanine527-N7)-methyltransferase
MQPGRIAELLAPFFERANDQGLSVIRTEPGDEPDDALCANISTYIDILLRWNERINLTAIREPEEIVTRHFGESLFAARHLFPNSGPTAGINQVAERGKNAADPASGETAVESGPAAAKSRFCLADLGSGAGFPGLPIKLWAPGISLTLIESNHKKAAFLREVTRVLTLTDVNVRNVRMGSRAAEKIHDPAELLDIVTLRAVEHFERALEIAATLVTPAGRLALLIGASQLEPARSMLPAFEWRPAFPVPQSKSRFLLLGDRMEPSK